MGMGEQSFSLDLAFFGRGDGNQSIGMALLKQDVSHSRKISEHLTYQAKLEGALRLALNVLRDGDASERAAVAEQLQETLKTQRG